MLFESEDGVVADVGAAHAGLHNAVGGLQEAAVAAEDLGAAVAGEVLEGLRAVEDGHVRGGGVAEEEGAGGVDGAEGDEGGGAEGDGDLWGGVSRRRRGRGVRVGRCGG